MCGIFGYIGKKDRAAELIFSGLKLLEYRGYDSWGIAVKDGKKLVIDKHIGKIGDAVVKLPKSSMGIGHTRWATHGGVTTANAHPHYDCTKHLALLHNGIIENYSEIKINLLKQGHTFISETDTEVAVHLIEEFEKKGEGFATSVRHAFNMLRGMNAIVVMNAISQEIIAAKTGSPLVVGVGEQEYYIASDAAGILKHTKKVIFIEDNQMVIIGKSLQILSLPEGKKLNPKIQTLTWEFEDSEKGKFPHFMLKEIYEQPKVIANIALNYLDITSQFAKRIDQAYGTFFIGCGTAAYAALAGTYFFSKIAKKHINFTIGSEFSYLEDYITPKTLVVPISQSGETIDVVDPVTKAQKKGAQITAVINVLGSTIYRMADYKVLLGAGQEKAVVATKSFSAMIAVLLLTAYTLAGRQKEGVALITKTVEDVQKILANSSIKKIQNVAKNLKNYEHIYIIGRGQSYATALEATLKIKETSYIHAEGFAGGELKHGVIALIEKGTPTIIFAPKDETYDEIISSAQEIKARGGYIIGIGPQNSDVFDEFLQTSDLKEATMLSQVVITQLLAYNLALERGIKDPDKPRNLAKSVVVK